MPTKKLRITHSIIVFCWWAHALKVCHKTKYSCAHFAHPTGKTIFDTLSVIAGALDASVKSYGYLRAEALRLRAKARLEDTQKTVINVEGKLGQPAQNEALTQENQTLKEEKLGLQEELLNEKKEGRKLREQLQQAEIRALKAEANISSSSKFTTK